VLAGVAACTSTDGDVFDECGAPEVFRVTSADLPLNNTEAVQRGHDLDNDGKIDNSLGQLASALHGTLGIDLDTAAKQRLANDTPWQLGLRRCGGDAIAISFTDLEPRGDELQLLGFADGDLIVATSAEDTEQPVTPVSVFFDPTATTTKGWVPGLRAHVELTAAGDELDGVFGAALVHPLAASAVVTALLPYFDAQPAGSAIHDVLDTDRDGTITYDEVMASSLAQSLLKPDVTTKAGDAVSFGIRVHAIRE
jgi:hypothetical protein